MGLASLPLPALEFFLHQAKDLIWHLVLRTLLVPGTWHSLPYTHHILGVRIKYTKHLGLCPSPWSVPSSSNPSSYPRHGGSLIAQDLRFSCLQRRDNTLLLLERPLITAGKENGMCLAPGRSFFDRWSLNLYIYWSLCWALQKGRGLGFFKYNVVTEEI